MAGRVRGAHPMTILSEDGPDSSTSLASKWHKCNRRPLQRKLEPGHRRRDVESSWAGRAGIDHEAAVLTVFGHPVRVSEHHDLRIETLQKRFRG